MKRILLLLGFAATLNAQGPGVSGVTPDQTTQGAGNTGITVLGGGFTPSTLVPGSTVFFDPDGAGAAGRSALATVYVSSNQLTATIPAGLLANAGTGTIDVANGTGSPSNAVPFTINPAPTIFNEAFSPGTVGVPYSDTATASGGTGALVYSISAGALPLGIGINSTSGLISGTPTTIQLATFVLRATDSIGIFTDRGYSIAITAPLTISPATLPNTTIGSSYSRSLVAAGGTSPHLFDISAGSLPTGLSLTSAGTISGVSTALGTFSFTVILTDDYGRTTTRSYSMVVNPAPNITTSSMPATTVGAAYNQTLAVAGGTPPHSFAVTTGSLPPGLTLSSAGAITGSSTGLGSFPFSAQAVDASGAADTQALTIVVNPAPGISTVTLPTGTAGVTYFATSISATGGTGALTFSIASGALPGGLTLSSGGLLSGTPSSAGLFNFVARATDTVGVFDDQALSVNVVAALSITTATLPGSSLGAPLARSLVAAGGQSPYSWAVSAGSLPPGVMLDASSGSIDGTPTSPGTFGFTVAVTDTAGAIASRVLALPILGITTSTLPPGKVGDLFNAPVSASGGSAPLSFAISSGSLPQGLALNSSGSISGTPVTPGNFAFTVRATDSAGIAHSAPLSIRIAPAELTITTEVLKNAVVNTPYAAALAATGGDGPYRWSVQTGVLPAGLSLDAATGAIGGTPTSAGIFRFGVLVTDTASSAGRLVSITVDPPVLSIITENLGPAPTGAVFSGSISAAGGVPPYSFEVVGGAVPAGLSLRSDGTVSGTPVSAGITSIRVRVTDSRGQTAARDIAVSVVATPTITTRTLPPATVNARFDATLSAAGGTPPYAFSIQSGSLPDGLAFDTTGLFSGIPARAGTFTFTAAVRDSGEQTGSQAFTVVVAPELRITTESLPSGTPLSGYTASVAVTGGTAPYTFLIQSGSLPDGLTMDSSGTLRGTPARSGSFPFTVRATDRDGRRAERGLSIAIGAILRITTTGLPAGTLGQEYSTGVAVSGGTAPYTFSMAGGSLPTGISLDASGVLSGRPMQPGTFAFSVRATEAGNPALTAEAVLSLQIGVPALPTPSIGGIPDTPAPATQHGVSVILSNPAPVPLSGTVTLTFVADNGPDDPAIVFSNGQRSASFSVAQGSANGLIEPTPLGLQTGTVAGTVTIVTRLSAGGVDVTPTPPPTRTIRISPGPPVIGRASLVKSGHSLQILVVGYSTTRQVTSATVRFDAAPGASLQSAEFTVSLEQQFVGFYSSVTSAPFGSQFTLTLPFNGDSSAVGSARVSLTNSLGSSSTATAN